MPYDPVRDAINSSPSPISRQSISMLLNNDDDKPKYRKPRFDPVHDSSLLPTPPASEYPTRGYFTPSPLTSPIMSTVGLALPAKYDPVHDPQNPPTPTSTRHPTLPSSNRAFTDSPTITSRPTTATTVSSIGSPRRSDMPPPLPRTAYKPLKRKTAPVSVLVPISLEEAQRLRSTNKNRLRRGPSSASSISASGRGHSNGGGGYDPSNAYGHAGPSSTRSPVIAAQETPRQNKRPHPDDARSQSQSYPSKRPHTGEDSSMVASHYNSRPEVGKSKRFDSPIIGLKSFNNWVKSVMINKFAGPTIRATNDSVRGNGRRRGPSKVLDLGCGKGGDLIKWNKVNTGTYIGLDIAAVSVEQARQRWHQLGPNKFDAEFVDMDCFGAPISARLNPHYLQQPFDAVTMQFCMHYAFETEERARIMLENVSTYLRPGGVFIGTIPNADRLMHMLKSVPPSSPDLSFGNAVYRIKFDPLSASTPSPIYGRKYWFYLQDAVDVPEFVVHWKPFVALAAEYGLKVIFKEEFHTIFAQEREHPEYKLLLERMKVVDKDGESSMDEDQWEAANIYIGFAFEKI